MPVSVLGWLAAALGLLNDPGLQKPLATPPATTNSIPGGTPFKFCPQSRDSDLFKISSAIIDRQPIYIDDTFKVYLEGEFLDTFTPNATLDITGNCGSYCDTYNVTDPRERLGETDTEDFCGFNPIRQPLGRHHKGPRCPPVKGPGMIDAAGWAMPMFVGSPGWYNFTFDAKTKEGRRIYCLTAEVCLRWKDDKKNEEQKTGPWGDCTWPEQGWEVSAGGDQLR
ncbi:hypothetical protein CC79DRAFT_1356710 [Sarocladium strictum]